jgi:excisionase family DNA binding protein
LSVEVSELLSVREAADRLGLSEQAIRQMAASGRLDGLKRSGRWWLDARAVERERRHRAGPGRPLSPAMAWSVLLAASGEPSAPLARHENHPARVRRWLAGHRLPDEAGRLRARARRERFDAHPSELARVLARDDVMKTGISAGELVGLHGGDDEAEGYAPLSHRERMIAEHALVPGDGPLLVRWVDDELWPVVGADIAPRVAVLVDLVEHDDPRARREAARALET